MVMSTYVPISRCPSKGLYKPEDLLEREVHVPPVAEEWPPEQKRYLHPIVATTLTRGTFGGS